MKRLPYIFLLFALLTSCASTRVVEQVNYRDSIITHNVYDTTHVTLTDTIHYEPTFITSSKLPNIGT